MVNGVTRFETAASGSVALSFSDKGVQGALTLYCEWGTGHTEENMS